MDFRKFNFFFVGLLVLAIAIQGRSATISETLKSHLQSRSQKYLIINVWSPECVACGAEVKELNAIYANPSLKDVVYLVGMSAKSNDRNIESFLKHFQPKYPQIETDVSLMRFAKVVPTTFLIDRDGEILKTWMGLVLTKEIVEFFDDLK